LEKLLSIGKVINFHGINGEVKVGYTAGREKQLTSIKNLYAVKDNKKTPLTVESIRFHKNNALIKFKEINSLNEAVDFKGALLKVNKDLLMSYLDEDEFYIDDLVGLKAYKQNGELIGEIDSVINQGREDNLLSIKSEEGRQILVPFVKALVPEVDLKQGKVVVNDIPGLLEE